MPKRIPADPDLTHGDRQLRRRRPGRKPVSFEPTPPVSPEMVEELRQILEREVGHPISTEYAEESAHNLLAFIRALAQLDGDAEPPPRDGRPLVPPAIPDDSQHGGPEVGLPRRG